MSARKSSLLELHNTPKLVLELSDRALAEAISDAMILRDQIENLVGWLRDEQWKRKNDVSRRKPK